jgi:acyl-CoA reductase-like NAD-dependent aldehyde dehydrogenase
MSIQKTTGKNPAAVALGSLGGKARAKALSPKQRKEIANKAVKAAKRARQRMTPEQRREIAQKAAGARWAKAKKEKSST